MSIDTTVAKNIRVAEEKARYDAACRKLLSEKSILAWIMKECLEEYRGCEVSEIVEKYIEGKPQVDEVAVAPDETNKGSMIHGSGNEDVSLTEGVITYDIRFLAVAPVSGELIRLIINVEAQNNFYPGYPLTKRGIYYCSRMISAQYGTEFTGSHYEGIKKVYSIWICMNPPQKRKSSITRYSITEENMVGNVKEKKANYDLMTSIMICLGEEDSNEKLLKLLAVLFSRKKGSKEKCQILEEEFKIEMTQELEREVLYMCNLSDGVYMEGIEKGIAEGIEKGIAKGIEALISMGRNLNLSNEAIIEQLKQLYDLSNEDAQQYLKKAGM